MDIKVVCDGCKGTGKTIMPQNIEVTCPFCKGKGYENKILFKSKAINVSCLNSECKHYYEELCMSVLNGESITLNCESECCNFEKGVNEGNSEENK